MDLKLMDFHRIAKLLCRAMWATWSLVSDDSGAGEWNSLNRSTNFGASNCKSVESGQTALKSYHLWHL